MKISEEEVEAAWSVLDELDTLVGLIYKKEVRLALDAAYRVRKANKKARRKAKKEPSALCDGLEGSFGLIAWKVKD